MRQWIYLTILVISAITIAAMLGVLAGLITGRPAYSAELCGNPGCRDLARMVWSEARGEPWRGQLAVAHVALNRLKAGTFGRSISAVIRAPSQFSAFNTKAGRQRLERLTVRDPAYRRAQLAAVLVLAGAAGDPTKGATYFHARRLRTPGYARRMTPIIIGNHKFYREKAK